MCSGSTTPMLDVTLLQMSDEVRGVEIFWLRSSMRDFLGIHLANCKFNVFFRQLVELPYQ